MSVRETDILHNQSGYNNKVKVPRLAIVITAFAAIYLIWGSTFLAIKYAIETLPPLSMAGVRFLFAGCILYFLTRVVWHKPRPTIAHWKSSFVIGFLLFFIGSGGIVAAQQSISSGMVALLVATEALWIVLLNWFFGGARPSLKVGVGLLLGFFGVWMLIGQIPLTAETGGYNPYIGALFVLGASLAWSAGSIYSARAHAPQSAFLASGMQMLAGGVVLLVVGWLRGEFDEINFEQFSFRSVFSLIYLTIFGSLIAYTAYNWLMRNVSPAKTSTYAYVNPVIAVWLGWAVADEQINSQIVLSGAVIIASVILITTDKVTVDNNAAE